MASLVFLNQNEKLQGEDLVKRAKELKHRFSYPPEPLSIRALAGIWAIKRMLTLTVGARGCRSIDGPQQTGPPEQSMTEALYACYRYSTPCLKMGSERRGLDSLKLGWVETLEKVEEEKT